MKSQENKRSFDGMRSTDPNTDKKANELQQNVPDRRLSRLEVSVGVTVLLSLLAFAAVFLNKQLLQNRTDQMFGRAQSVADWITAAQDVREKNAGLSPERCRRNKRPISSCFQNMVAPGQPLAGLSNIYSAERAVAPAFAFVAAPRLGKKLESCRDLPSPVFVSSPRLGTEVRPDDWKGVVIVQPLTVIDDLSVITNKLSIGYCDKQQRLIWVVPSVSF